MNWIRSWVLLVATLFGADSVAWAEQDDDSAWDANISYKVPLLRQPTDNTCWAAAIAMLAQVGGGYDRGKEPTPQAIVDTYPAYEDGLTLVEHGRVTTKHFQTVLSGFEMVLAPFKKYSAQELWNLFRDKGPLIIIYSTGNPFWELGSSHPPPSHLVVVKALYVLNDYEKGMEVTFHDPWKKAQSRTMKWSEFKKSLDELARRSRMNGYFIGHLKTKPRA